VLDSEISFNTPQDFNNPAFLFSKGGAKYKVFSNVRSSKIKTFPIEKIQ